jgi:hypothetical protein
MFISILVDFFNQFADNNITQNKYLRHEIKDCSFGAIENISNSVL